jgi:hypothetical protein
MANIDKDDFKFPDEIEETKGKPVDIEVNDGDVTIEDRKSVV